MIQHIYFGVVFILIANIIVFSSYFIARVTLSRKDDEEPDNAAASALSKISTMYALILGLFFAQQVQYYHNMNQIIISESGALRDIVSTAGLVQSPKKAEILVEVNSYVNLVVNEEWSSLGETGKLIDKTYESLTKVRELVFQIEANSHRELALRDHLLELIHNVASYRYQREHRTEEEILKLFWMASIVGLVLISVGMYYRRFDRYTFLILFLISAYSGTILSMNWSLSNPYYYPPIIEPDTYLRLIEQTKGAQGEVVRSDMQR